MKAVRIVIVSWNIEQLLESCLRSLPDACRGLDWECVVVDNASKDDCVGASRRLAQSIPQIRVIANNVNLGFGRACNQGAEGSDSRYLLFLNPDTYAPQDSLTRLVKLADKCPRSGINGPRLVYPDGRSQASIRRFPDVWSQAGILLKLHHVCPWLWTFHRYFADDVDAMREQNVEQVMGACFLVRRECWEEIGGFDERFFLWFEEVDRCKAAIEKGWNVTYLPHVQIVHHGGESFAQVLSLKKQRYYNASLLAFFQKWQPGWRVLVLRLLTSLACLESWAIEMLRLPVVAWSAFVVALEFVSALTIFRPSVNSIATFVLGIAVMLLAWKRPVAGLGILLLELLIGSKGQLLQFGDWPATISIRIVVTGMFLLGWGIHVIQKNRWKEVRRFFRGRMQYCILTPLILYALFRGWELGNGALVTKDFNAWLDWLLLIPVLDVVVAYRAQVRRVLVPVFFVSMFWLALKTLGLEYLFSHGFTSISPNAYLWVRRSGVGEVTHVIGNAFRIFMQSYVYATAAWILAAAWWFNQVSGHSLRSGRRIAWGVMFAATFVLAMSLSRSFWIGTAVGFITLIVLLRRARVPWWKRLLGPISAKLAALLLVGAVLAFPVPPVKMASLFDLFGSRTDLGEAAAVSRWRLLPILINKIGQHPILGSGFGATVSYQTSDPRILKEHPDGVYTTYAFEWGWLEHWVKFGIFGIPVMLWILLSLGWRLWRADEPFWFRAGVISSLIALATLHVFTPYLNHPLGFLYIFVGEGILAMKEMRVAEV